MRGGKRAVGSDLSRSLPPPCMDKDRGITVPEVSMGLTITDGGREDCFVHKRSQSWPECECDSHCELDVEADAASPFSFLGRFFPSSTSSVS